MRAKGRLALHHDRGETTVSYGILVAAFGAILVVVLMALGDDLVAVFNTLAGTTQVAPTTTIVMPTGTPSP